MPEALHIRNSKNALKEYLSKRDKKIITIMMALFDQQKAIERNLVTKRRKKAAYRSGYSAQSDTNSALSVPNRTVET